MKIVNIIYSNPQSQYFSVTIKPVKPQQCTHWRQWQKSNKNFWKASRKYSRPVTCILNVSIVLETISPYEKFLPKPSTNIGTSLLPMLHTHAPTHTHAHTHTRTHTHQHTHTTHTQHTHTHTTHTQHTHTPYSGLYSNQKFSKTCFITNFGGFIFEDNMMCIIAVQSTSNQNHMILRYFVLYYKKYIVLIVNKIDCFSSYSCSYYVYAKITHQGLIDWLQACESINFSNVY